MVPGILHIQYYYALKPPYTCYHNHTVIGLIPHGIARGLQIIRAQ